MQSGVVITGMGIVCAAGNDSRSAWRHLQTGASFLRPSIRYPQLGDLPVGEIADLDLSSILDIKSLRRAPLFIRYAIAAAHEAYFSANIGKSYPDRTRIGTSLGTSHGSTLCYLDENPDLPLAVKNGAIPRALARYPTAELNNLAAGLVSLKLHLQGPLLTPASGMLAGMHSLIDGYQTILSGDADLMVCGATDASIAPLGMAGYLAAGWMSEKEYMPYTDRADGFLLGEGACAVLLEERNLALDRGAPVLGEIVGYALKNCACSEAETEQWFSARSKALSQALERAGLKMADLSAVHLDAWALKESDLADKMLMDALYMHGFEGKSRTLKTQIGMTLGASSIIEIWASINRLAEEKGGVRCAAVVSSDLSGAVCAVVLKVHKAH